MALPVAAGSLAALWAAAVKTISAGVIDAHVQIFVWKITVRIFLFTMKVAALVLIVSLLANGVMDLFNTFAVQLPPMLGEGIERILPGNFIVCLSAILGTKFMVFMFAMSSKLTSMFLADF